jgi:hypothetical protein
VDPLVNFHIQMAPQLLNCLQDCMSKGIKVLQASKPVIATAVENIWKVLTLVIDLTVAWSHERNNRFVSQEVGEMR